MALRTPHCTLQDHPDPTSSPSHVRSKHMTMIDKEQLPATQCGKAYRAGINPLITSLKAGDVYVKTGKGEDLFPV